MNLLSADQHLIPYVACRDKSFKFLFYDDQNHWEGIINVNRNFDLTSVERKTIKQKMNLVSSRVVHQILFS